MLGTFALCYVGGTSKAGALNAAIAHGMVLGWFVYAGRNISGSHYNPAVTLAVLLTGADPNLGCGNAMMYMLFQWIGGVFAGMMVCYELMSNAAQLDGPGAPALAMGYNWYHGAICETVGTFFLVFTIFGIGVDPKGPKDLLGVMVGGMLTAQVLAIGGITGCAINPTRFFGPVVGTLFIRGWRGGPYQAAGVPEDAHWQNNGSFLIYLFPFLGALIGAFSYKYCFLYEGQDEPEPVEGGMIDVNIEMH